MATDYLSDARSALEDQLASLRDQQKRIERALRELGGAPRRGPGRPPGSGTGRRAAGSRRRRRRRGGTRREQALKIVRQNPGIRVSELATQLKIQPNYLYRVMGELESEGAVKKSGRGYQAA